MSTLAPTVYGPLTSSWRQGMEGWRRFWSLLGCCVLWIKKKKKGNENLQSHCPNCLVTAVTLWSPLWRKDCVSKPKFFGRKQSQQSCILEPEVPGQVASCRVVWWRHRAKGQWPVRDVRLGQLCGYHHWGEENVWDFTYSRSSVWTREEQTRSLHCKYTTYLSLGEAFKESLKIFTQVLLFLFK